MQKEKNSEVAILDFKSLPAYQNAEARQKQLVTDNPFITIKDSESFEIAKKRRTTLRKGRTDLQTGEKLIVTKITTFRKDVKTETEKLVAITQPHEDKQQKEIDRWEEQKRKAKEEKERLEKERTDKIKTSILAFVGTMKDSISKAVIENIEHIKTEIKEKHIECEEFQDDFDLQKEQLLELAEEKHLQIKESEKVRLENERLAKEKAAMELEKKRFQELKAITYIYEGDDLAKLTEEQYKAIYDQAKSEFDLIEAKRLANEEKEKEKKKLGEQRCRLLKELKCEADAEICSTMSEEVWDIFYKSKKETFEADQKKQKEEKLRLEKERAQETKRRVDSIKAIGYSFNYDEQLFEFGNISIDLSEFDLIKKENFDDNFLPESKRLFAEEAKRIEALRPDKEKLIETLSKIKEMPELDLKNITSRNTYDKFKMQVVELTNTYLKTIEKL